MKNIKSTAQLWIYLGIVFSCIAIIAVIYLGLDLSMAKVPWIFLLGSFTPTLAAIIVTALVYGKKGMSTLFSRWKATFNWNWMLISLSPFLIVAVGSVIYQSFFGGNWQGIKSPSGVEFIGLVLTALIVGSLGEEMGWRGFLLPRLQQKMLPLNASILLGIAWALFHFPLWFIKDSGYTMPMSMFLVIILSVTFIITIAFNMSGGSILSGYVLHTSFNLAGNIVLTTGLLPYDVYFPMMSVCYPLFAVILYVYIPKKYKSPQLKYINIV